MSHGSNRVSRRTTIAALGAGCIAFAGSRTGMSAQGTPDMADHPAAGVWLSMLPQPEGAAPVANPTIFSSDGSVVVVAPVTRSGPNGVTIASSGIGRWESTGERSIHFTVVQVLSTPDGAYVGTMTIDAYPHVSDDGLTLIDDSPDSHLTIHDPGGNVVSSNADAHIRVTQPLMGTRFEVGAPGLPGSTPAAGTPVS